MVRSIWEEKVVFSLHDFSASSPLDMDVSYGQLFKHEWLGFSLSLILSSTATTVTKSVSLGGSENRIKIAKAGAVKPLISLISFSDPLEVTRDAMFWVVVTETASGFLGLAISFTSMWFLHQTGPTTYILVGSLNKVPISLSGLVLFDVPLSLPNLFSILFGLFAGVVFARAKCHNRVSKPKYNSFAEAEDNLKKKKQRRKRLLNL
ncbi:hypothetical protein Bca4012_090531 [Brassica carinata]|uniref:(rape) hypothetical protein n=1 Tax=Brassica napus TaxID=3708 RepID=A0A078JGM2_BRANA|nr:unnamed protein product [Brassica napus]CDY65829.1 BnaC01g43990D [Brassica napus]